MYMPHPHNHEEWDARRAKYKYGRKKKQQAKKRRKSESDADNPPKKLASRNLYLAKNFTSAPATQVMFSDQESNQLVDDVLNGKFTEYDELKY